MAKLVFIEDALEGMVLNEPIVNNQGQTLLPAGITIGSNHLRILKTWNIRSIYIKEDKSEEDNKISDEMLLVSKEKLMSRIKWSPRLEIEEDLLNAAVYLNAVNLSQKGDEENDKS